MRTVGMRMLGTTSAEMIIMDSDTGYVFAPEKLSVQKEWTSEYQVNLQSKSNEVEKLEPNRSDKKNKYYIVVIYKYIYHLACKGKKYIEYLYSSKKY